MPQMVTVSALQPAKTPHATAWCVLADAWPVQVQAARDPALSEQHCVTGASWAASLPYTATQALSAGCTPASLHLSPLLQCLT